MIRGNEFGDNLPPSQQAQEELTIAFTTAWALVQLNIENAAYNEAFQNLFPKVHSYLLSECDRMNVDSDVLVTKVDEKLSHCDMNYNEIMGQHNVTINFTLEDLENFDSENTEDENDYMNTSIQMKSELTKLAIIASLGDNRSRLFEKPNVDQSVLENKKIVSKAFRELIFAEHCKNIWFNDLLAVDNPLFLQALINNEREDIESSLDFELDAVTEVFQELPIVLQTYQETYAQFIATIHRHADILPEELKTACMETAEELRYVIEMCGSILAANQATNLAEVYENMPLLSEDTDEALAQLESATQQSARVLDFSIKPRILKKTKFSQNANAVWLIDLVD